MVRKIYDISLNRDATITVKVGRARESIGLLGKTKADLFDAVKYALISKDAFISNDRLMQDLYELIWRHVD